jgi:hypothetical protein
VRKRFFRSEQNFKESLRPYDSFMSHRLSGEEHARWWKEAGGWQLRQLLYWQWDPIGVNDSFPWSYDEYDTYAGLVVTRLRNGADATEIARYLSEVAVETMGLSPPSGSSSSDDMARRIVEWYPSSIEWWRSRSR